MTVCCAPGCTNARRIGVKMFSIPSGKNDQERRQIWLHNIGGPNFQPNLSMRLCKIHFTEDQFEKNRPDKLKPNAIPTVFSPMSLMGNLDEVAEANDAGNFYEGVEEEAMDQDDDDDDDEYEDGRSEQDTENIELEEVLLTSDSVPEFHNLTCEADPVISSVSSHVKRKLLKKVLRAELEMSPSVDIKAEECAESSEILNLFNMSSVEQIEPLPKYWSDLMSNLFKFRDSGFLCDTLMTSKNKKYVAHSILLASVSPVFQMVFHENSTIGLHVVKLSEVEDAAVEIFLHYAYTGKLRMPLEFENADRFLQISAALQDLGLDIKNTLPEFTSDCLNINGKTFVKKEGDDGDYSEPEYNNNGDDHFRNNTVSTTASVVTELPCLRHSSVREVKTTVHVHDESRSEGLEKSIEDEFFDYVNNDQFNNFDIPTVVISNNEDLSSEISKKYIPVNRNLQKSKKLKKCRKNTKRTISDKFGRSAESHIPMSVSDVECLMSVGQVEPIEVKMNKSAHSERGYSGSNINTTLKRLKSFTIPTVVSDSDNEELLSLAIESNLEEESIGQEEAIGEVPQNVLENDEHTDSNSDFYNVTIPTVVSNNKELPSAIPASINGEIRKKWPKKLKKDISKVVKDRESLKPVEQSKNNVIPIVVSNFKRRAIPTVVSDIDLSLLIPDPVPELPCTIKKEEISSQNDAEQDKTNETKAFNDHDYNKIQRSPGMLVMRADYVCDVCDMTFKCRPPYLTHMRSFKHAHRVKEISEGVAEPTPFRRRRFRNLPTICHLCGKLMTQGSIKGHMESMHDKMANYKCMYCTRAFHRAQYLSLHVRKVHYEVDPRRTESEYVCDKCGKIFTNIISLRAHKYTHIAKNKKKYYYSHSTDRHACPICNKTFSSNDYLTQHVLTHADAKTHLCSQCGKGFYTKGSLIQHMIQHRSNDEKKWSCGECGKKYSYQFMLRNHQLTHNNEKPFVCQFCPKKFQTKGSLSYHLKMHSNENPYNCHLCGYSATKPFNLGRHLVHHSDERLYECDMCTSAFKDKYDVREHCRRVHRNELPITSQASYSEMPSTDTVEYVTAEQVSFQDVNDAIDNINNAIDDVNEGLKDEFVD